MSIQNRDTIIAQAEELAQRMLLLAHDIVQYKTMYDWWVWKQNGNEVLEPVVNDGIQALSFIASDSSGVLVNHRDNLYELAHAPKPIEE